MDDWLVIDRSKDNAKQTAKKLFDLIIELGFVMTDKKCEGPSQELTFLGFRINTNTMTLTLTQKKRDKIKKMLVWFLSKNVVKLRKLRELTGTLNFVSHVVFGGRTYTRRLYNCMKGKSHSDEWVILSANAKKDLKWWSECMHLWDGKAIILDPLPLDNRLFQTDASSKAAGAFFNGHWLIHSFVGAEMKWDIGVKEMYAVWMAVREWKEHLRGFEVTNMHVDNTGIVSAVNRLVSKSEGTMEMVYDLHKWSATLNFRLKVEYIKSEDNVLADAISRFDWQRFRKFAQENDILVRSGKCV
jgi:hypothetical protein